MSDQESTTPEPEDTASHAEASITENVCVLCCKPVPASKYTSRFVVVTCSERCRQVRRAAKIKEYSKVRATAKAEAAGRVYVARGANGFAAQLRQIKKWRNE
jgi:hypothetical protein